MMEVVVVVVVVGRSRCTGTGVPHVAGVQVAVPSSF